MSTPLSLSDCIDALGGTVAVARACGLTSTAVSNWKAAGEVPPRHAIALWTMAKRAGLPWQPPGTEHLDLILADEHAGEHGEPSSFPQQIRNSAA